MPDRVPPTLRVLPGRAVAELLSGREAQVIEWVRAAYLSFHDGDSVNPPSHFLRFPHRPEARIIALPAYAGRDIGTAGIKWIASFPGNVASGLPRASAILVLNDAESGYPLVVMEAAMVSAARTAASAALAAATLATKPPRTAGIVGAGVIARTICSYLPAAGIEPEEFRCHDLDPASAGHLVGHLGKAHQAQLEEALDADLVVLATTAASPYIPASHRLRPDQLVLNISLRDLAPQLILGANNILDDVDHCLTANTSPHLAESLAGNRDFVTGTLAGMLRGGVRLDPDKPTIFSPFGLGVLDIAVGTHLLRLAGDRLIEIADFYGETRRW